MEMLHDIFNTFFSQLGTSHRSGFVFHLEWVLFVSVSLLLPQLLFRTVIQITPAPPISLLTKALHRGLQRSI